MRGDWQAVRPKRIVAHHGTVVTGINETRRFVRPFANAQSRAMRASAPFGLTKITVERGTRHKH